MTAPIAEAQSLSTECRLATRPGYNELHDSCIQTKDIFLPHGLDILLQRRCGCPCHQVNYPALRGHARR